MTSQCDRREVLKRAGAAVLGGALSRADLWAAAQGKPAKGQGCVVGQPVAAKVGMDVLAAGGNAVDAAVAAALTAGVVAVQHCGIGGYGGHMVIAPPGEKVTAIDFNTAAPAAAREDMFPLDDKGAVKGRINTYGWLAAGVPGTLAGLQLALDRHGTRPFGKLVQPAIAFAGDGFEVGRPLATAIRSAQAQLRKDPASTKLLLSKGQPLKAGAVYRNPELADLLQTLAQRNSVDSFYRGDIGQQIARAFEKNGGLVTAKDMAAYQARVVTPLELTWRGHTIYTAPLTAGGLTVLEALAILKAMAWERRPAQDPSALHARLDALRLAWDHRLKLLGDPEKVDVPVERLLSESHARSMAGQVQEALRKKQPVQAEGDGQSAGGTVHLSAADSRGMTVALTLTHGGHFGAQVAVDGLGLILGHGMSRFDPRPKRPNSPGPHKRPLHNMCPTVVVRDGRAILALGAAGGRRIPNAVYDVLAHFVGRDASVEDALEVPRLHTEGDRTLTLENKWPEDDLDYLKKLGYTAKAGPSAVVHAVELDAKSGRCHAASR
jgi:gamma-glutamyltranspeptidase / glutathione hydrolase